MKFLELTDKPRPDDGSEPIIKAFVKFTSQKLGLTEPPKIKLQRNPKLASQRHSFGGYTPGQGIEINIGNRHIMDVLRTLAHEMVHYKQDINGELKPDSGKDGSDEENEANAKAAVVMRLWAKMNPELFQHATILAESQKKRLTPKNIHKIADKKGIKWDDEPAFLKLTRRVAGHRYLDDLDQDGLFKMKNYLDRLDERNSQVNKLVIFDIDDTLVHTNTRVKVVNDNKVVKQLNSHEFTHYKLGPGEQFDFGAFRNAREFFDNAKPIVPMIQQLRDDIATGNKVVMITARADFDDRDTFLNTFKQWQVDMDKVHVYRAGNDTRSIAIDEKKAAIIRNLMDQNNFNKVIMYDDSIPNLDSFVNLKKAYPHTKFYAWHVDHDGETSEYQRTNENRLNDTIQDLTYKVDEVKKRKRKIRHAAYGPGPYGLYGVNTGYSGDGGDGGVGENFADGKNPQDKGDSARHGIPKKASLSSLDKIGHGSGRKAQLARWQANMRRGRNKND